MTIQKDILPLCVSFPKVTAVCDCRRCTHRPPRPASFGDGWAPSCPECFKLTLAPGGGPSRNGPSQLEQELQEAVWGPGGPRCPICPSFAPHHFRSLHRFLLIQGVLCPALTEGSLAACLQQGQCFCPTRRYPRCSLKLQLSETNARLNLTSGSWSLGICLSLPAPTLHS